MGIVFWLFHFGCAKILSQFSYLAVINITFQSFPTIKDVSFYDSFSIIFFYIFENTHSNMFFMWNWYQWKFLFQVFFVLYIVYQILLWYYFNPEKSLFLYKNWESYINKFCIILFQQIFHRNIICLSFILLWYIITWLNIKCAIVYAKMIFFSYETCYCFDILCLFF